MNKSASFIDDLSTLTTEDMATYRFGLKRRIDQYANTLKVEASDPFALIPGVVANLGARIDMYVDEYNRTTRFMCTYRAPICESIK